MLRKLCRLGLDPLGSWFLEGNSRQKVKEMEVRKTGEGEEKREGDVPWLLWE